MDFSRPSLHPPVVASEEDMKLAETRFSELLATRPPATGEVDATSGFIEIPLTTISMGGNFDSYISVGPRSASGEAQFIPLLFDTGNTVLVLPEWEAIAALPDWQSNYQVLCNGYEPWGCPANVVKGPIQIMTQRGQIYTLQDCIFYACTGVPKKGDTRTANFGAGRVSSPTNVCTDQQMLTPLMYNMSRPYAEINLAPSRVHSRSHRGHQGRIRLLPQIVQGTAGGLQPLRHHRRSGLDVADPEVAQHRNRQDRLARQYPFADRDGRHRRRPDEPQRSRRTSFQSDVARHGSQPNLGEIQGRRLSTLDELYLDADQHHHRTR